MALSGFGQSPANRGKANTWHKATLEAAIRLTEVKPPSSEGSFALYGFR